MKTKLPEVRYVSGDEFVAAQTRRLEREFHCSKPRPRNRAMGFRDEEKKREKPFGW